MARASIFLLVLSLFFPVPAGSASLGANPPVVITSPSEIGILCDTIDWMFVLLANGNTGPSTGLEAASAALGSLKANKEGGNISWFRGCSDNGWAKTLWERSWVEVTLEPT